jgi:hypothetical protein
MAFTQEREFIDAKAAGIWLGIPLRSLYQYVQKRLPQATNWDDIASFGRMNFFPSAG